MLNVSKQIFYLNNARLTAYTWQAGKLTGKEVFEHDQGGWEAFDAYLADSDRKPARLLVDVVEEDFQREIVPHVLGKARAALIERKLLQYYRDTPLRQASMQGREKSGRKDDKLLLSGLTKPEHVRPWLAALESRQVPLEGIYSASFLSASLFKQLGAPSGPTLLVTMHSGGLRQSYFDDAHLRFSRLTLLPSAGISEMASTAATEIARTRQFLISARMMPHDASINIIVVMRDAEWAALAPRCQSGEAIHFHPVTIDAACDMVGHRQLQGISTIDTLLVSMLGGKRLAQHYAFPEQTRFYRLWQCRAALYASSAFLIAGGIVWTGANAVKSWNASRSAQMMEFESERATRLYKTILQSMPSTVANPHDMKTVVDVEHAISLNSPSPRTLMELVSTELDRIPQLNITSLKWSVSETDENQAEDPALSAAPQDESGISSNLIGLTGKPFEVLLLEGEVPLEHNDFRTALENVQRLSSELAKIKGLRVKVQQMPLDTRSNVKLTAQSGDSSEANKMLAFQMKLIWKPQI